MPTDDNFFTMVGEISAFSFGTSGSREVAGFWLTPFCDGFEFGYRANRPGTLCGERKSYWSVTVDEFQRALGHRPEPKETLNRLQQHLQYRVSGDVVVFNDFFAMAEDVCALTETWGFEVTLTHDGVKIGYALNQGHPHPGTVRVVPFDVFWKARSDPRWRGTLQRLQVLQPRPPAMQREETRTLQLLAAKPMTLWEHLLED